MARSEHRIGLLGGTFDPPHLAHLRIAEEARIAFHLSEIWFIPASYPPHKKESLFNFEERLTMLELATRANPFFKVLDLEREERPSYTLYTLKKLKSLYPENRFFLIVGFDGFKEIETWWHYQEFLNYCDLIVVSRGLGNWKSAETFVKEKAKELWKELGEERVHFLEVFPFELSSTLIRDLIKKGKTIRYLVPEEVYLYLKERGVLKS